MIEADAVRGRAISASFNKFNGNFDSKTNHIVLTAAECGPVPTLCRRADGGRAPKLPNTFTTLVVGN